MGKLQCIWYFPTLNDYYVAITPGTEVMQGDVISDISARL